jgi:uncharacterized protein
MTEKSLNAYAGGVTKAVGDRQVRVVVSTASVDRHGDIVEITGIELENYRKNPVVLCQHDHDEPIARCVQVGIVNGRLEALVQFPDEGVSSKSDEVYGLVKAGVLNAVSIGFIPMEWSFLDDKNPWEGRRFSRCEMIEFSIVSVPANADALIIERGQLTLDQQIALARANIGAIAAQKAGRKISAATEEKLRGAHTAIGEVLSQVQADDDAGDDPANMPVEDAAPEGPVEPDEDDAIREREIRALELKTLGIADG